MPTISERGKKMPESAIRKLVPYAEKAIKDGKHVHHLNIGQPDLPPSDTTLTAIRETPLNNIIGYSHSAGNISYRKKLAEYYKKQNIDINYDDILITTGGSEAILFAFLSCLNAGDEIIIPEPFYANYNGFAAASGVKVRPVTSTIENDFALPPVKEFEQMITAKTKGIFINNPNNPTGYLYSKEEIEQLGALVKKHDLYLFGDEVYRGLCYEESAPFFSVMHLKGLEKNIVLIDSASKRYNACGLRVGAMITKNRALYDTAMKFAQSRLSPPHFGQIAGEAALDSTPEYLNKIFYEFKSRRDFLVKALNNIEGVFCPTPKGAFYVIAQLPVDDSEKFCQWILSDFEYDNQTVMLAPASGFYSTPGFGKNQIRIAYVLKSDDLKKAIKCLEEGIKAYPGNTIKKNSEMVL
jgi:aspartate aminotransferase